MPDPPKKRKKRKPRPRHRKKYKRDSLETLPPSEGKASPVAGSSLMSNKIIKEECLGLGDATQSSQKETSQGSGVNNKPRRISMEVSSPPEIKISAAPVLEKNKQHQTKESQKSAGSGTKSLISPSKKERAINEPCCSSLATCKNVDTVDANGNGNKEKPVLKRSLSSASTASVGSDLDEQFTFDDPIKVEEQPPPNMSYASILKHNILYNYKDNLGAVNKYKSRIADFLEKSCSPDDSVSVASTSDSIVTCGTDSTVTTDSALISVTDSALISVTDSGVGSSQESYYDENSNHALSVDEKNEQKSSRSKQGRRRSTSSSKVDKSETTTSKSKGVKRKKSKDGEGPKKIAKIQHPCSKYLTQASLLLGHQQETKSLKAENPVRIISDVLVQYLQSKDGDRWLQSNAGRKWLTSREVQGVLLSALTKSKSPSLGGEDMSVCIMCQDRPRDAAIIHGQVSHQATCYQCAKTLMQRKQRCPVCRRKILMISKHIIA